MISLLGGVGSTTVLQPLPWRMLENSLEMFSFRRGTKAKGRGQSGRRDADASKLDTDAGADGGHRGVGPRRDRAAVVLVLPHHRKYISL